MVIFGIIGLIFIIGAIFIEDNRKQARVELVGGLLLLVYSISIHNVIFIILQTVYILAAGYEIINTRTSKAQNHKKTRKTQKHSSLMISCVT